MTTYAGHDVYGSAANEAETLAALHRSLELGGNFLDTADAYGPFLNERLIAQAVKGKREQYIIATKFGYEIDGQGQQTGGVKGTPAYVKLAAERSLKNLGTDYIDLYYLHRLDPNTPVEETVGAMSELVREGKVRYLGLSEVASDTIRKAHAIHPITALQTEYSLFDRAVERAGILNTLMELGIGFVAYSPLGRGFVTGKLESPDDLEESDWRRYIPRFQSEQFQRNLELLKEVEQLARHKGVSVAQIAIAWVVAKGYVPIPGTKRKKYVEENLAAADIVLTEAEMNHLEEIIPLDTDTGQGYEDSFAETV